jgi:tRNA(Ile)-lysidine synthase
MRTLADRVFRTITRERLISRGRRVLVALSGGPDSVALLHVLLDLADRGGFRVAGAAHLNHRLRGEASDADEAFCRELATAKALPLDVGRVDVAADARRSGVSVEVAGRLARYGFLADAAARLQADVVAVGHTRDDQAETLLLRLLRGSGSRGLGAIHPRRDAIVRPLIDVRRREILRYLEARALPFRLDETNMDVSNPRNRIRHELIPWLERHVSPATVDILARTAAIAREDAAWLESASIEAADRLVRTSSGVAEIDLTGLRDLPRALARRLVRRALGLVDSPGDEPARGSAGFAHVEALLDLAAAPGGSGTLDLPGVVATREGGGVLRLRRETSAGRRMRPRGTSFCVQLSVPGEAAVEAAGVVVHAIVSDQPTSSATAAGLPDRAVVKVDGLQLPLTVRNRRPGDVFRPPGFSGRKKLQDFFVDRKVPRRERDSIPLVVDAGERIVWIVGHAVAADFGVPRPGERVITLTAKPLGGVS